MRRAAFVSALTLALVVAIGIVGQQKANAQTPDSRVADLVRAGKLRAGVGVVAPHWAIKDPQTGEVRGVAVDIARALARRLGIELVAVEYPSPPAVLGGLKDSAWDIGFLAIDPSPRDCCRLLSLVSLQIDATYLVPDGSSIRNVTDADQPGVRIAVTSKSVEEIVLSRSLKRAELRSVATISAGFDLLRAGNADVLAAPRPALLPLSSRLPGSRVLADRFHAALGAMAVPKGQTARLAYIAEFVEEAKASGLVQRAIESAGVREESRSHLLARSSKLTCRRFSLLLIDHGTLCYRGSGLVQDNLLRHRDSLLASVDDFRCGPTRKLPSPVLEG